MPRSAVRQRVEEHPEWLESFLDAQAAVEAILLVKAVQDLFSNKLPPHRPELVERWKRALPPGMLELPSPDLLRALWHIAHLRDKERLASLLANPLGKRPVSLKILKERLKAVGAVLEEEEERNW